MQGRSIKPSINLPMNDLCPQRQLLSRRAFLTNASLATLALPARPLFAALDSSPAVVRTPNGVLRGESAGGVQVFRGVPFAEPPVGPLRFRPPVKIEPWSGQRDATRFAASAMQW